MAIERTIKVARYTHENLKGAEESMLVCDACFGKYHAKHRLYRFRGYLKSNKGYCVYCGRQS